MSTPFSDALRELRRQFSDQLSDRMGAIRSQFQRLDPAAWDLAGAESLHRLVHGLTGSAGTFGMQSLSESARGLETRLAALLKLARAPDDLEWQAIGAALDSLDQLARIRLESKAPSLKQPEMPRRLDRSPLIYLVEDDAAQSEHLSQLLRDEGYRIRVFAHPAEFRAVINDPGVERPAAVVMDMIFPEGDDTGVLLISELGLGKGSEIPVVVASVRDDLTGRLAAFRAGASRYLSKPVQPGQLIDLLDALTGRQPPKPYRVLLVDDDALLLDAHAAVLRAAGMEVRTLLEPLRTLEAVDAFDPDVLVLDVYMPEASGPELASVLRERDVHLHLPILFLSSETDMDQQLLALNLGGDDFLVKPVQPHHLAAAITARARRARQNTAMRQRLQTTLYEREREHLALDQHAIVSIANAAGVITYVNDKFCEIGGYSREEMLGRTHNIVKSAEHPPEFFTKLWRTIAGGQVWQGEICNRRKDGSLYWVESTITPFLGADGRPYQYVSIRTDISHVKAAEAAVEQLKERLRRGQLYANIGTWEWDIRSGALYWTERIAPLFGYPAGNLETTYENFLDAIHPDDRQAVMDAVNACVERDAPYEIEHRVVWPDGTVRWLLERGAVARDAQGKALQMVGVVQDIDDRKRAELGLIERERQLREAQTLARIGNWTADLRSGELIWSDEIYRIFGRQPGNFAPSVEAFLAAVHPDDLDKVRESEKRSEQTGVHDVVHRIVRPDGSVGHVHELARTERNAAGEVVRLLGTVQDVTERVEAEARLHDSEQRFSFAVEGAGDGIWDWNMLTGEMPLSGHYETMLGYAVGELEPHIDAWLKSVHPDDLPQVQQLMQDYLAGTVAAYAPELRLRCKDGSYKWILCRGTVVARDGQGQAVRMIGIHSDISERKEVEAALLEARESAELANQAKSEFLSSMSHELRTPMNAILGFGQLMEYDGALPGEHQDNVREILKAGHHLLGLINEVLDLAKVESGRIDLSLESVTVLPVVEECLSLVRTLADRRQIRISHTGLTGAAVRADRTRLKQALLNLLSNAIKYNREGGSVELDVLREGTDRLRIHVTDSGYGIPAHRLKELFQPFNRLDAENSDIEGSGIGLTITRRIVEMMGGTVDVASEVGVGSNFWIELPLESLPDSDHDAAGEASPSSLLAQGLAERGRLVLYIEDNPSNIKLVAQILGRRKHIHLLTAHTPDLGIELAMARRPELILLDVNMPGMDGYQVLKVLRADARSKNIPVIAVTANAMPRDIERGLVAGFADYLTKPLEVGKFIQLMDRTLRDGKE